MSSLQRLGSSKIKAHLHFAQLRMDQIQQDLAKKRPKTARNEPKMCQRGPKTGKKCASPLAKSSKFSSGQRSAKCSASSPLAVRLTTTAKGRLRA